MWKINKQDTADVICELVELCKKLQEAEYYAECPTWMWGPDVVNRARIMAAAYKRRISNLNKLIDKGEA